MVSNLLSELCWNDEVSVRCAAYTVNRRVCVCGNALTSSLLITIFITYIINWARNQTFISNHINVISQSTVFARSFVLSGSPVILSVGFMLPVYGAFGLDWVRELEMRPNTCKCSCEHLDFLVVCATKKQQNWQQQHQQRSVKAVQLNDSFYIHNNIFMFACIFRSLCILTVFLSLRGTLSLFLASTRNILCSMITWVNFEYEKNMRGRCCSIWHLHAAKPRVWKWNFWCCRWWVLFSVHIKKNRRAAQRFFSNRTKILLGACRFISFDSGTVFPSTCFLCHSLVSLSRCHSSPVHILFGMHAAQFIFYNLRVPFFPLPFCGSNAQFLKLLYLKQSAMQREKTIDSNRFEVLVLKRCHVQIIDKILRENIGISHKQSVKFTALLFRIFHMCVRVCSVGEFLAQRQREKTQKRSDKKATAATTSR